MKSKTFLKGVLICAGMISGTAAVAQDEVGTLIKSSPADATKLATAYLNPLFKGFGVGLNSGWNNTGRAKNTGRFEFRVGITGAFVPEADKTFDVAKLGLSNSIRPVNPANTIAPSVSGETSDGPEMGIYNDSFSTTQPMETFKLPGGANLPFIPAPQLQATVGLPKGIDVTLRAMPKVTLPEGAGTLNMIGGGVKVDVLPLLLNKTADKIIPVDLGVAVGYTQLKYNLPLDVQPQSGTQPENGQQGDWSNQMVDATFSGINAEVILSKKLMFFTPFLSVGYNTATTDVGLKGNYPIVTGVNTQTGTPTYTTFTNPVSIKNKDIKGLRSNVGFQLNLAVLRIYTSYSMADYNAFNFGLGIGLGK